MAIVAILVICTKFHCHRPFGSEEDFFIKVFYHDMAIVAILVTRVIATVLTGSAVITHDVTLYRHRVRVPI